MWREKNSTPWSDAQHLWRKEAMLMASWEWILGPIELSYSMKLDFYFLKGKSYFWKFFSLTDSSWILAHNICVASLLWAIKSFLLPKFCFLLFDGNLKCFPCKLNLEAVGKVIMNPVLHCTNHPVSQVSPKISTIGLPWKSLLIWLLYLVIHHRFF